MWAIAKREFFVFFSSGIGYLTIGGYITVTTLFLWFFDTNFNLINAGFADLNSYFCIESMAINVSDSGIVYEKFFGGNANWNPRIIINKTYNPLENYFRKIYRCNAFGADCFFINFYLFFGNI